MNTRWSRNGGMAAIASAIVLALFYYWFALADRYAVFLYGHVAINIAPAQPFDDLTASRYWMAGLVAAGSVATLSVIACFAWEVVTHNPKVTDALSWWRAWLFCVLPIGIGIPAITMTCNTPTLPWPLAMACSASALAGTGLALAAAEWAARRPVALLWALADGLGLVPPLQLIRAVELPGRGLSLSWANVVMIVVIGLLCGAAWLGLLSWLRYRRGEAHLGALPMMAAGFGWSYLALPLAHYVFATPPGFRYITAASNFFAFDPGVQALAFAVAAATSLAFSRLRQGLAKPSVVVH